MVNFLKKSLNTTYNNVTTTTKKEAFRAQTFEFNLLNQLFVVVVKFIHLHTPHHIIMIFFFKLFHKQIYQLNFKKRKKYAAGKKILQIFKGKEEKKKKS